MDLLGEAGARRRADELVAEADAALAPYGARADMLRADRPLTSSGARNDPIPAVGLPIQMEGLSVRHKWA